jgi:hypothetical protein
MSREQACGCLWQSRCFSGESRPPREPWNWLATDCSMFALRPLLVRLLSGPWRRRASPGHWRACSEPCSRGARRPAHHVSIRLVTDCSIFLRRRASLGTCRPISAPCSRGASARRPALRVPIRLVTDCNILLRRRASLGTCRPISAPCNRSGGARRPAHLESILVATYCSLFAPRLSFA